MELTYIIGVNGVSLGLRNELKRVLECGDLMRSKINRWTTEIKVQARLKSYLSSQLRDLVSEVEICTRCRLECARSGDGAAGNNLRYSRKVMTSQFDRFYKQFLKMIFGPWIGRGVTLLWMGRAWWALARFELTKLRRSMFISTN